MKIAVEEYTEALIAAKPNVSCCQDCGSDNTNGSGDPISFSDIKIIEIKKTLKQLIKDKL